MADKYANLLYDQVTESAANTLTFKEINIGLSLFDKVGILIHQLHWYSYDAKLIAAGDAIQFGLSQSDSWAAASPAETSIITFEDLLVVDHGTAGNAVIWHTPFINDFTTLPGGGLLTVPKPLFLFSVGANLAAASLVKLRMYFTIITLKAEEYLELLETRQFFG